MESETDDPGSASKRKSENPIDDPYTKRIKTDDPTIDIVLPRNASNPLCTGCRIYGKHTPSAFVCTRCCDDYEHPENLNVIGLGVFCIGCTAKQCTFWRPDHTDAYKDKRIEIAIKHGLDFGVCSYHAMKYEQCCSICLDQSNGRAEVPFHRNNCCIDCNKNVCNKHWNEEHGLCIICASSNDKDDEDDKEQ